VAPAEELQALQRRFEKEDAVSLLTQACRAERGLFHQWCTEMVDVDWSSTEPDGPEGPRRLKGIPTRAQERFIRGHAYGLQLYERHLEWSRQPLPIRGTARPSAYPPVDYKLLGTPGIYIMEFSKLETRDREHHTRLRCIAAILAAERYRLKHSRWPEKIDDLKDLAAKETLIDPCDGKPLRLRCEPDGLVIYSVGSNGVDDGGTEETLRGRDSLDIGFRLWDVAHRRQPPVPRPPPDDDLPPGGPPPP
jgi:hypothetical protein